MMRIVVLLFVLGILYSLGSALFHLVRSKNGTDPKVLRGLTLRISLSVGLFLILMVGYKLGWIGEKI